MVLHFEGLRKRVMKNFFIIVMITVALFEGVFIYYIQNYYYESIRKELKTQAYYANPYYNSGLSIQTSSFEKKVNEILEKNNIEDNRKYFSIEIIDKNKKLIVDQYGIKTDKIVDYVDVDKALKNSKNIEPYRYKIKETDEHVMSVSVPIKVNNVIEGVIRYTVSLSEIDDTIVKIVLGLLMIGAVILLIGMSLSLRFADTIIKPLEELKQFANELAHGNFSIKLKNNKISDDEIGDLAQTFVHMASEIDKSEKLKEEFISSISHELRTPLTSIKGWSETLGYEGISKVELDLGLGIIQEETERMIKLVEELLDFSRLASARIKLRIDMVNIEGLVKGVMTQLAVKAMEKNIKLSYHIENEAIESVQGDKDRLRQVLINLIQNSIKFTDEGGFVKIIVSQNTDFTEFKVIDNGAGIETENLQKVLDKFFQEDYNKAGSGLGLSISNEIVKLHGGSMDINSVKGEGTEITFTIKNIHIESIE